MSCRHPIGGAEGRRRVAPPIPTPVDWPPDYVVFRQALTTEERSPCADDIHTRQPIGAHAWAGLDAPIAERVFFRVVPLPGGKHGP